MLLVWNMAFGLDRIGAHGTLQGPRALKANGFMSTLYSCMQFYRLVARHMVC